MIFCYYNVASVKSRVRGKMNPKTRLANKNDMTVEFI